MRSCIVQFLDHNKNWGIKLSNLQENLERVQAQRATEVEQHEIVKKYLEHRQLMRQTESALSRASLDTKMLQEANENILQARTRVAQRKARTAKMETALTQGTTLPPVDNPEVRPESHLQKFRNTVVVRHDTLSGKTPTKVN